MKPRDLTNVMIKHYQTEGNRAAVARAFKEEELRAEAVAKRVERDEVKAKLPRAEQLQQTAARNVAP